MRRRGGGAGPRGPERWDLHPTELTENILGHVIDSVCDTEYRELRGSSWEPKVSQGFGYLLRRNLSVKICEINLFLLIRSPRNTWGLCAFAQVKFDMSIIQYFLLIRFLHIALWREHLYFMKYQEYWWGRICHPVIFCKLITWGDSEKFTQMDVLHK